MHLTYYLTIYPLTLREEGIVFWKKLSLVLCLVLVVGYLLSGCSISTEPITAGNASGLWRKVFVDH